MKRVSYRIVLYGIVTLAMGAWLGPCGEGEISAFCGDGVCNGSETGNSCPEDCCGTNGGFSNCCGDDVCNNSETTLTCPQDCCDRSGGFMNCCGDGFCVGFTENSHSCPEDCPCEDPTSVCAGLAKGDRCYGDNYSGECNGCECVPQALFRSDCYDLSVGDPCVRIDFKDGPLDGQCDVNFICQPNCPPSACKVWWSPCSINNLAGNCTTDCQCRLCGQNTPCYNKRIGDSCTAPDGSLVGKCDNWCRCVSVCQDAASPCFGKRGGEICPIGNMAGTWAGTCSDCECTFPVLPYQLQTPTRIDPFHTLVPTETSRPPASPTPSQTATSFVFPTSIPTNTPQPPTEAPAPGTIKGFVYNDNNGNGLRNTGDEGIAGVVVSLHQGGCGGAVVDTSTTSGNGQYNFPGLPVGTYCVSINVAPNCQSPSVPTTATQFSVTLSSGETVVYRFGLGSLVC